MSYEPKTWVTGEVITADDLNLITPFVEPIVMDEGQNEATMHTAEYVYNAVKNGRVGFVLRDRTTEGMAMYEVIVYIGQNGEPSSYEMYTLTLDSGEVALKYYTAPTGDDKFVASNPK